MTRALQLLAALLLSLAVSSVAAKDNQACDPAVGKPGAARALATKFFKDNVNGKSVFVPATTFPVAGGKVESVSSTTVRFGNFTETERVLVHVQEALQRLNIAFGVALAQVTGPSIPGAESVLGTRGRGACSLMVWEKGRAWRRVSDEDV